MFITRDVFYSLNPCGAGVEIFETYNPNGADLQVMIDGLIWLNQDPFGFWMLDEFGKLEPSNEIVHYTEGIQSKSIIHHGIVDIDNEIALKRNLFASGDITINGNARINRDIKCKNLTVNGDLFCGLHVHVDGNIEVHGKLEVGLSLTATGSIYARDGVYGGVRCPASNKGHGDIIRAAERPDNIVAGTWYEEESND